jgi:LysR family transcriptional activator of nhaA
VVAEVGDSALLKTFGQAGIGLFAGPSAIEPEIRRQYAVSVVGRADEVRERFYAISVERRLKHPAVLAISQAARESLFTARRRPRDRKQDEPAAADGAVAEEVVEA